MDRHFVLLISCNCRCFDFDSIQYTEAYLIPGSTGNFDRLGSRSVYLILGQLFDNNSNNQSPGSLDILTGPSKIKGSLSHLGCPVLK